MKRKYNEMNSFGCVKCRFEIASHSESWEGLTEGVEIHFFIFLSITGKNLLFDWKRRKEIKDKLANQIKLKQNQQN